MIYRNILIEVTDAAVAQFKPTVPVYFNFSTIHPIGSARITRKWDGLYADIEISENSHVITKGLYPAIGGTINKRKKTYSVDCVSLCVSKNIDDNIKPLEE